MGEFFSGFSFAAWPYFLLLAVGILLSLALWILWRGRERYPYIRRQLFSKTELHFFQTLVKAVPSELLLFSKVRLWDVIDAQEGRDYGKYTAKIRAKHLDFLLCDQSGTPLLAIELDDPSHERPDRRERDRFVNRALSAAGISILHVPTAKRYDEAALRRQIRQTLPG